MPKVKSPIFSFAAQGSLGDIHYSHHDGKTFAYRTGQRPWDPGSPKQQAIRADFVRSELYWQGFEPQIRRIFSYLKDNKRVEFIKDCKRARMTPKNMWQSIYFAEVPMEIHGAALAVVVAYIILKYGWVILFF